VQARRRASLILWAGGALLAAAGLLLAVTRSARDSPLLAPPPARHDSELPATAGAEREAAQAEDGSRVAAAQPSHPEVEFARPPIEGLEMIVIAEATGQPVPSANVRVAPFSGAGEPQQALTDAAGRASVTPDSEAPLRAEAWLGELYGSRGYVFAGQTITLHLRASVETTVLVEDESGRGVEDALVRFIEGVRYVAWGTTDAQGFSPRLRVPAEEVTLEVVGRDFDRVKLAPPEGGVPPLWRIAIQLRGIEVGGVVTHGSEPVEEVVVYDYDEGTSYHRARTGADGRFRLGRYDPGDLVLVRAEDPRFLPITLPYYASEENPEVLLELPAGLALAVRVVDPAGRPVPEAHIRAHWSGGWAPEPSAPGHSFLYFREGTTDERGECVLRGMGGGQYELRVRHPAFNEAEIASGERDLVVELEPRTDVPVRIRLVPELERIFGLEHWSIAVHRHYGSGPRSGGGMPRQQTTDRRGIAVLRQLAAGSYVLSVASPERRWVEHCGVVELTGDPWDYLGPDVVVKLEPEPSITESFLLSGEGYTAIFTKVDGVWTAAARSGPARLKGGGTTRLLRIEGTGGVRWVRLSGLEVEGPRGGGSEDGE